MNKKTEEIIEKALINKSKSIAFDNCDLTTIPKEVLCMHWLEELIIKQSILQHKNISNQIIIPDDIGKLSKLKMILIQGSYSGALIKIKNTKALKKLKNLETFILHSVEDDNDLSNLPFSFLSSLKNLKLLNLYSNKIKDVSFLSDLTSLESLFLTRNKIVDFSFLSSLKNLEMLNLSGNGINDILSFKGLNNLKSLSLFRNNIKDVSFLRDLTNLESLNLGINRIEDISSLSHLTNLESLDLESNRIEDISSLSDLNSLKSLIISKNKIKDLSPLLGMLNKGLKVSTEDVYSWDYKGIRVDENNWITPPLHIIERGTDAILNYFENLENEGEDYLYEAKLIIVGQGSVGKTSLRQKLRDRNNPLPKEDDTTKGIDIEKYTFNFDADKEFTANIWDFGGQEIYKTTHQFFLTKRSLYVLVDDTRSNDVTVKDASFKYWLQTIELFGGGSPLLIFLNEKSDRSKDIDLKSMQGRFSFIKDKFADNLSTPSKGLNDFETAVQHHITSLPHIGEVLPKKWVLLRNELLEIAKERPYISLKEYKNLCFKNEIEDEESIFNLSHHLHDLGTFLHYDEHDILRKTIILQNKWATDAVYKVLDCESIKESRGVFKKQEVKEIWQEEKYSDMRTELLYLMEKFELCYKIDSEEDTYLIPQLLPESRPDTFEWDETENLQLIYQYDFMPKGLLSTFIVRNHSYINDIELCWKKGVILEKDNTQAFIEDVYADNRILIRLKGENKRDFLTIIQAEFDKLNKKYEGLKVAKEIPCNCDTCKPLSEPIFINMTASLSVLS